MVLNWEENRLLGCHLYAFLSDAIARKWRFVRTLERRRVKILEPRDNKVIPPKTLEARKAPTAFASHQQARPSRVWPFSLHGLPNQRSTWLTSEHPLWVRMLAFFVLLNFTSSPCPFFCPFKEFLIRNFWPHPREESPILFYITPRKKKSLLLFGTRSVGMLLQ